MTDDGSNLNYKMMKDLCKSFKIEHHNSSLYRPKMNGAVEAANKNIKKIEQKMVETYKVVMRCSHFHCMAIVLQYAPLLGKTPALSCMT